MKQIKLYISLNEKISSLDDYIQERLHINKDTGKYISEFIFKPEKEKNEYAKEINNLKVSLPFDIIVNNNTYNDKRITISKIEYNTKYNFDSWILYDINDKYIMGLTNNGIRRLFIKNEQIDIYLYGDSTNNSYVIIDPKTLTIL